MSCESSLFVLAGVEVVGTVALSGFSGGVIVVVVVTEGGCVCRGSRSGGKKLVEDTSQYDPCCVVA